MKKTIAAIGISVCLILTACVKIPAAESDAPEEAGNPATLNDYIENARFGREFLQKYRFDDSVRQVLVVSHTGGWNATASFYEKPEDSSTWVLCLQSDAIIGENGMGKTIEGDKKTPVGDYEITGAFGILKNPGTALEYTEVKPGIFVCNEDCEYYNRIIDSELTGHDCAGEEMYMISPEYNYGLTLSYNSANKYPEGSAIFVHCKGEKPNTGGCIAMDEEDMKIILSSAEKGMRIFLE